MSSAIHEPARQLRVELAARLGHRGARELCPEAEQVDWSTELGIRDCDAWLTGVRSLSESQQRRLALDIAERFVRPDSDPRARVALQVARMRVEGKATAANASDALVFANELHDGLYMRETMLVSRRRRVPAELTAQLTVSQAAANAIRGVPWPIFGSDANELAWQRQRLAAYLLGEA